MFSVITLLLIAPIWNGNLDKKQRLCQKTYAFNRTNLEWKQCKDNAGQTQDINKLLIAPIWNGNVIQTAIPQTTQHF